MNPVIIGNATLYNADCREVLPILSGVDAVITDPPYGTTANEWDSIIEVDFMWNELNRIAKQNTPVLLFANQPFTSLLITSNLNMFKYCLVWDKGVSGSFANANYQPLKTHEDICVFGKQRTFYYPQMTKRDSIQRIGGVKGKSTQGGRIINYNSSKLDENKVYDTAFPKSVHYFSPREDTERGLHPTQKPIRLLNYITSTYSKKEDVVLDFTMGSGTTGVAAVQMDRKFIGIEIDNKYFDIACKRIEDAQRQQRMF